MRARPLLVGALVAVVGVALVLLGLQRGADDVSGSDAGSSATTDTADRTATSGVTPAPDTATVTGPAPTAEPPAPPSTALETGATLRIPSIDLAADLHAEGLRNGRINPPAGTVMWFTGYDRVDPGEVGTSVIAGHVVAGGRPDAFADLAGVSEGDEVELVGDDGAVDTFTVVRAGLVDKDDLTVDQTVWGANGSVRRLAIITCDDALGFRDDGHRVANYVVIAEPA